MRILYDGLIYGTQAAGGINRYFQNVIARLPEGDTAMLTTPQARDVNFPAHRDLEVHVPRMVRPAALAKVARPVQLRRAERRFGHDLVHPTYYAMQTFRSMHRSRVPLALTVWDMTHEKFRAQLDPRGIHAYVKRRAVTGADALLCISDNTRRDLVEHYRVDESRIHVIHLATELSDAIVTGAEQVPDRPYFLYVGARPEYKNFDLLLRALAALPRAHVDVGLCVVGAPLTAAERERARALGVEERLIEAGVADDARVAALYASSVAFVYPSRYEGFGIPPLEAMACGTVAITSNSSSIPEVVGDAALTFDPESVEQLVAHMQTVLDDAGDLRARMVARGRARAAQFSWDRTAAETFDVYRALVD